MKHLLTFILLLPFIAVADDHSASAPVETWNCSLNEGQSMETVLTISKAVGAWSKSKGLNDAQWIFTPSSGKKWAKHFRDFSAMVKELSYSQISMRQRPAIHEISGLLSTLTTMGHNKRVKVLGLKRGQAPCRPLLPN